MRVRRSGAIRRRRRTRSIAGRRTSRGRPDAFAQQVAVSVVAALDAAGARITFPRSAPDEDSDIQRSSALGRNPTDMVEALVATIQSAVREALSTPRADIASITASVRAELPAGFDAYGPFYREAELTAWLGISSQTLTRWVEEHQVLACVAADEVLLFPTWQFDQVTRSVLDGVSTALQILLPAALSSWTVAAWFRTPNVCFGGRSALDLIRDRAVDTVIAEAIADSRQWSQ